MLPSLFRPEKNHFHDASRGTAIVFILREAFTVPANLRRIQQSLASYALAQLSGTNSVTSYLMPILSICIVGQNADPCPSVPLLRLSRAGSVLLSMVNIVFEYCPTLFTSRDSACHALILTVQLSSLPTGERGVLSKTWP